jgi:hypothetical protein
VGKEHTVHFSVDAVHLPTGVKAKHLVNAGLLVASFRSGDPGADGAGGEQVLDVNFVVQVERAPSGEKGAYQRVIFNPLQED